MKRFFAKFLVRVGVLAVVVALLAGVGWLSTALGWAAFAYLLWRAGPGIRKDLRRVWRGIPVAPTGLARF